jgi:hypothetical protein
MARYEIHGFGRDTGRRRRHVYDAATEALALEAAAKDGTVTESVELMPDDGGGPATDRQIAYARDLGIDFSANVTRHAISEMIDGVLNCKHEPIPELAALAAKLHVARIGYWKPDERRTTERMVEPYELLVMRIDDGELHYVRCWQISPAEAGRDGWRNFRADRIRSVHDAGEVFNPRQAVTLHLGTSRPFEYDESEGIIHHAGRPDSGSTRNRLSAPRRNHKSTSTEPGTISRNWGGLLAEIRIFILPD